MKNFSASLLVLLLALAGQLASAQTIRRVNNTGLTGTNIYADFASAQTAAANGDIIQFEPSGTSYGTVNVTKNLTIVGPGYFLGSSQNPGLQANPASANLNELYFSSGSSGASVAGLVISYVYVGASNVTLQRCKVDLYLQLGYSAGTTNINIRQNYLTYVQNYTSYPVNNILMTNNVVQGYVSFPGYFNGEFSNNIVLSYVSMDNFNVRNNYFNNSFTPNSNIYNNNASSSSSFSTSNGNLANVPFASVFASASPTYDAQFALKAGTNPLRNAGQGGTDIGIFGGNVPYKLGGLPAIPAIYQLTQSISGNTLNVNLSTRANN